MKIERIIISNKSSIEFRIFDVQNESISFGDLIQVVFKGTTYYFNVNEIVFNRNSTIIFVTAEQTGSSSYKLSKKLKSQDMIDFCDSTCEKITDQSIINGVRQAACLC